MSQVIEVIQRYEIPDLPPTDLPYDDGEPMESNWHRIQIGLLVESIHQRWPGRTDFFAGGNMFIYYSMKQVRDRNYKGPDFFVVKGVDGTRNRHSWIAWEEDARLPDVIVELLSPSTAYQDLGAKKDLYERIFKTPDYFCCDADVASLQGWRLSDVRYAPLSANEHGRLWSEELQAWLGPWTGEYQGTIATWLRLFLPDGTLVATQAEAERERAEAERERAESAEAELVRLRAELERLKG
ncbi:MAG: Uma2 family endonuclease [Chloroflexi bacterium]|nr:Uma2 family endonuclease [Chloroflexota bacterium]